MNRQRYEPVPQRDETINLDSITGYNYNSGVPSSIASYTPSASSHSHHAPSIHSIPNSPPPSFHTLSSPGTPRPTPSTTHQSTQNPHSSSNSYAELWGVAPSTSAPTEICAGSEALATITALQTRVQKLEETIGRLLLEKDVISPEKYKGGNCCMTFVDATPDIERGIAAAGGHCCVWFKSSKRKDWNWGDREREVWGAITRIIIIFLFCAMVVGIIVVTRGWGQ